MLLRRRGLNDLLGRLLANLNLIKLIFIPVTISCRFKIHPSNWVMIDHVISF
jgi:hypothetical protein